MLNIAEVRDAIAAAGINNEDAKCLAFDICHLSPDYVIKNPILQDYHQDIVDSVISISNKQREDLNSDN